MQTNSSSDSTAQQRGGRRSFLAALGVVAAGGLAGCSVSLDIGDSGDGDRSPPATEGGPSQTTPQSTATPEPRPTVTPEATPAELEPILLEPEPQTAILQPVDSGPARYRLHNFRLYVVTANDGTFNGPNTEELYGDIYVRGYDSRDGSRVLAEGFDYESGLVDTVLEGDAIEIREGGYATDLDLDVVIPFPEGGSVDEAGSYIEVGMDLFERDPVANDIFGLLSTGSYRRWSLSADPTDPTRTDRNHEAEFDIGFNEDGSYVRLSYDVSVLAD